jgi:quercetin dioxygenase-like cupin family protein
MTRCVRLFTGLDQRSHVEEMNLPLGALEKAKVVHFEQSQPHASFDWHTAPCRQYVVTLTGTLEFTTRDGETFNLAPGDVLLAEDTTGSGHRWRLLDEAPWLRLYVELE